MVLERIRARTRGLVLSFPPSTGRRLGAETVAGPEPLSVSESLLESLRVLLGVKADDPTQDASLWERAVDDPRAFQIATLTQLAKVAEGIQALRDSLRPTPRYTRGDTSWMVRRVIIATAGNAKQGPDLIVPDGFVVSIRLRTSSPSGTTGYLAPTEQEVSNDSARIVMARGDAVSLAIPNMRDVWMDSDTDAAEFELLAEQ